MYWLASGELKMLRAVDVWLIMGAILFVFNRVIVVRVDFILPVDENPLFTVGGEEGGMPELFCAGTMAVCISPASLVSFRDGCFVLK